MEYTLKIKNPNVEEFILLRETTGWSRLRRDSIQKALQNTLFGLCVYDGDNIVGMGRVIGDNAIYFYIQDVIVLPEYKNKGIGKLIMEKLIHYVQEQPHQNIFLGLMSAENVKEFYLGLGFEERGANRPGMHKIINKY